VIGPGDLVGHLQELQSRFETALLAAGLDPLPDRRYYTVGGAVYDCPQIVVSADTVTPGLTNAQSSGIPTLLESCDTIWSVTSTVAYVACAAEVVQGARGTKAPPIADVERDAANMALAVSALVALVEDLVGDPKFGSALASITLGQPQGGLIAAEATITANLWYPDPVI
jgi:hypothetical protein